MFSNQLVELAENVISTCKKYNLRLVTAESCTGGLIAGCLTSVSGASDVLQFGFVTYTNQAKINLLGVPANILREHGAVSEIVSRSMANGAIGPGNADISVSVTGIAGPGGGSNEKPVGLVHISVSRNHFDTLHERYLFDGDREAVRLQTVKAALKLLLKHLETQP